jgi:hypothetical protein
MIDGESVLPDHPDEDWSSGHSKKWPDEKFRVFWLQNEATA